MATVAHPRQSNKQTNALRALVETFQAPEIAPADDIRINADGVAVIRYTAEQGTSHADDVLTTMTTWEDHLVDAVRSEEQLPDGWGVMVHGTLHGTWVAVQAVFTPPLPVPGDPGDLLDGDE